MENIILSVYSVSNYISERAECNLSYIAFWDMSDQGMLENQKSSIAKR